MNFPLPLFCPGCGVAADRKAYFYLYSCEYLGKWREVVIILLGRIVSDGRFSGSATAFGGCEGEPRGQQRGDSHSQGLLGTGWLGSGMGPTDRSTRCPAFWS